MKSTHFCNTCTILTILLFVSLYLPKYCLPTFIGLCYWAIRYLRQRCQKETISWVIYVINLPVAEDCVAHLIGYIILLHLYNFPDIFLVYIF